MGAAGMASLADRLLRSRGLVALGVLPALAIGIPSGFEISTSPPSVTPRSVIALSATSRVLFEDPTASSADLVPKDPDALGMRVRLMADLLATDDRRRETARRAGIAFDQLTVIAPASDAIKVMVPVASEASTAAAVPQTPYALEVAADGKIPIVTLSASAPPGPVSEKRLIAAAVGTLEQMVASGRTRLSGPAMTMSPLGPPSAVITRNRSNPVVGIVAALVVFGAWWAAVATLRALLPRSRRLARSRATPARL